MAESRIPASYSGVHVLVVGGGVAALETAFALRGLAGDLVDVEFLAPEPRFLYRPQAVFEPFGGLRVQAFELAELAEALRAQLTLGELASVTPSRHVARTRNGMTIPYDVLVIASGASPSAVLHDAVTFRGPADEDRLAALVNDAKRGDIEHLTLAIPTLCTWPLPIYEVAFGLRSITNGSLTLATVEPAAGAVLGEAGSEWLTSMLASRNIELETDVVFDRFARGVTIAAPELRAALVYGIPVDGDGFIPTNRFGAVVGVPDVYAAGDVTSYPVKHGSIAAAQADTVAESIAAAAGVALAATHFRPILRARIACGDESVYVRRDLEDPRDPGLVSLDPLWSPPAKIFARHLAPALAEVARRHQRSGLSLT